MDITNKMNKKDTEEFAKNFVEYSRLFKEEKGRLPRYHWEISQWLTKKLKMLDKQPE
jgi:hypothetical protein